MGAGLSCEPDCPKEISDGEIDEFHSNLREVILYIKYSLDKAKLDEIIEGDSKFQSVERQAAEVINVVTGFKKIYRRERNCEYVFGYPNFGITLHP